MPNSGVCKGIFWYNIAEIMWFLVVNGKVEFYVFYVKAMFWMSVMNSIVYK